MTGTNDKLRGLLLAVLMVTSVFAGTIAFAGTAAAVNSNVDTIGTPVEYNDGSNTIVEVVLNQELENDDTLFVFNRSEAQVGEFGVDDSSVVDVVGVDTNFRYVLDLKSNDLSGSATVGVSDDDTVGSIVDNFSVTTTSSTVNATSLTDGGTAVGTADSEAFSGEQVAILGAAANDANAKDIPYSVTLDDDFVKSRSTGVASVVAVEDTNDLVSGVTYNYTFDSDDTVPLEILSLGLSASAADTSVTFNTDENADVSVNVTSSVSDRPILATLVDSNGDEIDETTETIGPDGEVQVELNTDEEGDYTIEVEDLNTGITDETGTITVSSVSTDAAASFSQSVYSDERGDIIEFTIDLTEVDTAEVSVGSPAGQSDIGYGAVFNVTDDSDDGQVTVQLNTFETGNPDPETGTIAVADDDDSVSDIVLATTGQPQPLDGATYDINTSVEGEESDVAALSLTQNAPEAFTLFTAPSVNDIEDAESTADINSFKEDGSVTESSRITSGDLVIHQLEVSGLEGAVAARGGLLGLLNASTDADLSIVQTDATTAPNRDAKVLFNSSNNVNELNDVKIIEDGDNDTYFINFPVSEGDATDDSDLVVDAGDEYEVTVTINEASGLVNEDTAVSRTFTVAERSVDLNTNDELDTGEDIIRVAAGDGQVISGGTSAAPGTDVVVRARATGDSPFLLSQTATVDSSRSFSAEFDFSGISEGQSFEVTAEADRGGDDEVNAVVDAAPTASVDISSQSGAGDTVIVDSVSLSDGGFVTIHDSTVGSDPIGSVLGTSAYLEAGDYTDVEVTLDTPIEESQSVIAMPHQDTDGDQTYDFVSSGGEDDAPYVGDGGNAVTAQAEYTVEAAETATPEPETDAPETDAPETDAPETDAPETDEPETTTATDGQPGFGVIVALLAFLAAALIAIRRD